MEPSDGFYPGGAPPSDAPVGDLNDMESFINWCHADTSTTIIPASVSDFEDLTTRYEDSLASHPAADQTSWSSALSDSSVASAESAASSTFHRRRRLRARKAKPPSFCQPPPADKRRYQCTFCTDCFKTKHDWQRHERTLHLSLNQWQCLKFGPAAMDPDGSCHCVFCGIQDPTADHYETHSYSTCAAKPASDRVFFRKDHLLQHLRLVHNESRFNDRMASWVSTLDVVRSRCGFCDMQLETWSEREKHLAGHFKAGTDMKDWRGDRGFDPEIECMVQDDMPAYMIAQQRGTVEPFSASRPYHCTPLAAFADTRQQQQHQGGSETGGTVSGPPTAIHGHSPRHVERLMLDYVTAEIRQGRVPSDAQIRRQMGVCMYGPDYDGWEQTWADNEQWLGQFRKKAGLISLPLSEGKNAFVGHDAL